MGLPHSHGFFNSCPFVKRFSVDQVLGCPTDCNSFNSSLRFSTCESNPFPFTSIDPFISRVQQSIYHQLIILQIIGLRQAQIYAVYSLFSIPSVIIYISQLERSTDTVLLLKNICFVLRGKLFFLHNGCWQMCVVISPSYGKLYVYVVFRTK